MWSVVWICDICINCHLLTFIILRARLWLLYSLPPLRALMGVLPQLLYQIRLCSGVEGNGTTRSCRWDSAPVLLIQTCITPQDFQGFFFYLPFQTMWRPSPPHWKVTQDSSLSSPASVLCQHCPGKGEKGLPCLQHNWNHPPNLMETIHQYMDSSMLGHRH